MKTAALWVTHRGTQTFGSDAPAATIPNLQRMLESIVISNWKDVMPEMQKGMVDVEYRLAPDHSLEYLRLWASSRWGFSDLICQYSMFWHWSSSKEVTFGPGYGSKPLAKVLDYVIRNASTFRDTSGTANGLVHIYPSTEGERQSADRFIASARGRSVS